MTDDFVEEIKKGLNECKEKNCLKDFINEHEDDIIKSIIEEAEVRELDRQEREYFREQGKKEYRKKAIKNMLNYYMKSMTHEDAKKLIIEVLNIKEEDFEDAINK